jgi:subtilisin family serine protease
MTVRVAVIDSGVNATHSHIGGIAGGVAFDEDGREHADYVDRLGHGTAVAAAIREKAPDADLFAVKVFDRALSTRVANLVRAIDWAAQSGLDVANLSLGTARAEHEPVLRDVVDRAASAGLFVVAARDDDGVRWLPGSLTGVISVQVDWSCPRDGYHVVVIDGVPVFRASGFPRPIPGVPPDRNLNGISFAVANMTGFLARTLESCEDRTFDAVVAHLAAHASAARGETHVASAFRRTRSG